MVFHGLPPCDIDVFFQHLEKANILTRTDLAWGWFVKDHFSLSDQDLIFTTIFLSHLVSKNHICLRLDYWGGRCFPEKRDPLNPLVTFEDKDQWLEKIHQAPTQMITSIGEEENPSSLMVVDPDGDIYFNKYYHYQKNIAQLLRERMDDNRLLIITGGPGTGKTSRVFEQIWEVKQRNPEARIALLAPTGKAASRLREAVIEAKQKQLQQEKHSLKNAVQDIPDETYTVHRFLSKMTHPASSAWRANWDLVVVDEASMISFPLFHELLTVIRDAAQLVLLGDKDQLSSVEEGSLFYDLADNSQAQSPLNRYIHCLEKNYRYPEGSRIAQAAAAIRTGGEKGYQVFMQSLCKDTLSPPQREGIGEYDLVYFSDYDRQRVEAVWTNFFKPRYQKVFSEVSDYLRSRKENSGVNEEVASHENKRDRILDSLFDLHKNQIILCARRKGMWGMETMNHLVGEWLRDLRVESQGDFPERSRLYNKVKLSIGDPLIVNQNRYELDLYNGDIGVVFPVWRNGNWAYRVFFENSEGGYREHLPEMLGELDRAYALTVHKSQGSEFDSVMVLMGDEGSDFLTREICYTALTRAREKVFFFMAEEELQRSLSRVGVCHSGLRKYLLKATLGKGRE